MSSCNYCITNILASSKGAKGEKGYEGIPGFQGVKVFIFPPFSVFLKSRYCDIILSCFYYQGEKGTTGAAGRAGPRGKQVGCCGIPCSIVNNKTLSTFKIL